MKGVVATFQEVSKIQADERTIRQNLYSKGLYARYCFDDIMSENPRMQRLVELSGNDGLTGLPNRSWLLQRMPRIFDQVRDGGGSLTLALIDLDHFKRVNDDIGHLAANRALRQVAALMSDALGPGERLVRIGGQEFVALLHCPIGSAWERADRLRRAVGFVG